MYKYQIYKRSIGNQKTIQGKNKILKNLNIPKKNTKNTKEFELTSRNPTVLEIGTVGGY